MSTRYTDPTWEECPSCRAVVPAGSLFCPECGARMDARPEPRRRPDSRYEPAYPPPPPARETPPWMPIVLGFGGAAIIGIAVLLVILLTRGDPAIAEATPTPEPSASDAASEEPSTSAEPSEEATPTPSPSPTPRPSLANRSIAAVQSDGVELRTQPAGGEVIGTLGSGSRVFIIGAPQDAAQRWYRVAVVGGPYSGCDGDNCPNDIGYLSDGASEEDATLADVDLDCPRSPMTAAELNTLLPLERLVCYGASSIVVTGTLTACFCDGPIETSYRPSWLAAPIAQYLFAGTDTLWARFEDEPGGPDDLEIGDVVEATVAMEHGSAPECSVTGPPGADVPTRPEIVLYCRTQLVVEDYEITGFDPSVQP